VSTTRTVAAFDFDHTISNRDNVLAFLIEVGGRARLTRALIATTPDLARRRRDQVKRSVTRAILRGYPADKLKTKAQTFAQEIISHHIRPDVLARAQWHRAQGHQLVIVSASYACYLNFVAAHLGFDAVLATELATDAARQTLTGELLGANVYGAEKVNRLEAWIGPEPALIWAYGDSAGDNELLARANYPVRVGKPPLPSSPIER
jgi:phosphatidylglycerophosphatase C